MGSNAPEEGTGGSRVTVLTDLNDLGRHVGGGGGGGGGVWSIIEAAWRKGSRWLSR